ncbi:MAG: insulinase family protein [Armatimonadetes bacterium]|nr:insulinase family protein [Armatimonadota bacterium]MDW8121210.1 pitrilysin family protein [Armatimonadota bacterium]
MAGNDVLRTQAATGLRVVAKRILNCPLAHLEGFIIGGHLLDPPDQWGRTNLTVRAMRKGTQRRTAEEIDEALESRGAYLALSATSEGISLRLTCLPDDLQDCLNILAEIVTEPAFKETEVAKERNRLLSSLRQDLTRPEEVSFRLFAQLAYSEEHPFHRPASGHPDTVEPLTPEACWRCHQETVLPSRAIFAVVADQDPSALAELTLRSFESWTTPSSELTAVPEAPVPSEPRRERQVLPDRTQCWVTMGHPSVRRTDPLFYPAHLLTTILGAGWGRLFTEIRDNQGLAYAVGASLQSGLGPGPFFVRMGINPHDIDRAIDGVLQELNKIVKEPPDFSEIEDAKNYVVGRLRVSMETSAGIAGVLLSCELFGLGLDYPDKIRAHYEPIGRDDLAEAASRLIFPDRLAIAIAGP